MFFGLGWSGAFAGAEWSLGGARDTWPWGWPLAAGLAYIVIDGHPGLRTGRGRAALGPVAAGFLGLTHPRSQTLLSAAFLGEAPHLYHGAAFVPIVGGIVVSSCR